MKTVAFVTYNTVGGNIANGWHEGAEGRRALVIQNSTGNRWAVNAIVGPADELPPDYRRSDQQFVDCVRDEIGALWGQLQQMLSDLDHVVVYVGSKGSERAIALAAQLPPSKVTFVACDCGLPIKEAMIQVAGMDAAGRVLCECGGQRTMERLFQRFMEAGVFR